MEELEMSEMPSFLTGLALRLNLTEDDYDKLCQCSIAMTVLLEDRGTEKQGA